MEYGIWLSRSFNGNRKNFHTLRVCRNHGLEEFSFYITRGRPNWRCLKCARQIMRGVHTSKIAGCSNTVGLIIAEAVLSKAFLTMVKAPPRTSFDFTGPCGLKIDSKCSTLGMSKGKIGQGWQFHIGENKTPDVFCLIALDNLPGVKPEDANPVHVWLIRGDAIIDGRPLNERKILSTTPRTLTRLEPYRRMDMEGRVIMCCDKLKEHTYG